MARPATASLRNSIHQTDPALRLSRRARRDALRTRHIQHPFGPFRVTTRKRGVVVNLKKRLKRPGRRGTEKTQQLMSCNRFPPGEQSQRGDAQDCHRCRLGHRRSGVEDDQLARNRCSQLHTLLVERIVDQCVVRPVNNAVIIEIAIEPAGKAIETAIVDQAVIRPVHFAIEIGIPVIGVLNKPGLMKQPAGRDGYRLLLRSNQASQLVTSSLEGDGRDQNQARHVFFVVHNVHWTRARPVYFRV